MVAAGADAVEVGHPLLGPHDGRPGDPGGLGRWPWAAAPPPRSVIDGVAAAGIGVPVAVMTYYNLVYRAGHRRMARSLAAAGVSGAIVPDLPLEELGPWAEEADAAGVETVLLVAPSTPRRAGGRASATRCRGFVYAVARMGVTGERADARRARRPRWSAGSGRHRPAGLRRRRGVHARAGGRGRARWPTAWWWARPWCAGCSRAAGPEAAAGVRGRAARGALDRGLTRRAVRAEAGQREDQAAVVAAEAEGVREHRPGLPGAGLALHHVEVDLGVELLAAEVGGMRRWSMVSTEATASMAPAAAEAVAGDALGRGHQRARRRRRPC